jgi:hypothetical protein
MISLAMNDLIELSKRANRDYTNLKESGQIKYCCISQKSIFLVSQLMLYLLSENINAEITITLKKKEQG